MIVIQMSREVPPFGAKIMMGAMVGRKLEVPRGLYASEVLVVKAPQECSWR